MMLLRQRGITLIETMIVIILIGVLSIMILPSAQLAAGLAEQTEREHQRQTNARIVSGLINYAKSSALGSLPNPYTSTGVAKKAVADLTNSNLVSQLLTSGVDNQKINDDGSSAKNLRVYQLVTGLTQNVPLYVQTGPTAQLTYQFGVVYSTYCFVAATCFTGQTTPGSSTEMTSSNFKTWNTVGTDHSPVFVSSLPIQKEMLSVTVKRLDRIRDSMISNFSARVMLATPSDTTNWHPTGATSLAGQTPGTNQGCRDGWYDLSATNVLDQIGLTAAENGVTSWGGIIEFCRDYDPTGASGANTIPHYAAIRINRDVSAGGVPDTSVTGNNILISF